MRRVMLRRFKSSTRHVVRLIAQAEIFLVSGAVSLHTSRYGAVGEAHLTLNQVFRVRWFESIYRHSRARVRVPGAEKYYRRRSVSV